MEKRRLTTFRHGILLVAMIITVLAACRGRTEQPAGQRADAVHSRPQIEALDSFPAVEEGEPDSPTQYTSTDTSLTHRFQYTWADTLQMPPILIIVDDFGYATGSLLQGFAELPPEVVFAILPDLQFTQAAIDKAAQYNRDVMIHIPMEAMGASIKPGERYIKRGMTEEDVFEMISAFYAQMPGAIAANQHMGSTTTADPVLMRYVLRSLDKLGLVFLDSATTTNLVSPALSSEMGIRTMMRDIFLDVPDSSDSTLEEKIKILPRYRGRVEPIVIITHCHNRFKLEALQKFITQIKAMGYELISLSDALKRLPNRPPV